MMKCDTIMGVDLQTFDTGIGNFMALLGSVLFESKLIENEVVVVHCRFSKHC